MLHNTHGERYAGWYNPISLRLTTAARLLPVLSPCAFTEAGSRRVRPLPCGPGGDFNERTGTMMQRHFVTFFSPGTFVSEQTTQPIDEWDVDKATVMARQVVERHNATPYAFQFSTRRRKDSALDSTVVARSGRYFLGGTVLTLDDVKRRNRSEDRILISNMESNGCERVIETCNSWKTVQVLKADDTVLEFAPA